MAQNTNETKGQMICRRYDEGKQDRANFDRRVDILAPFIDPTRVGATSQKTQGAALMGDVYDAEGIYASDLCANFVGGQIHSPGSLWFTLKDERGEVNRVDEAREWFEECRNRMLNDLATSNFYGEVSEIDKDWLSFGTGDGPLEERDIEPYTESTGYRGCKLTAYKVGRFVLRESGSHQVDARDSEFDLNAFAARERFGNEVMKIAEISESITNGDYNRKFKFIHSVYPRKQEDRKYGKESKPWASCYVEYHSKEIVKESGYDEFPDLVPRQPRVPGEFYGRGLGDKALNFCLTASAVTRMKLENLALKIKPPLTQWHDAVVGKQRLIPGAPLTIRRMGTGPVSDSIQALQVGGDFQAAMFEIEDLRKAIRRSFHVDQLQQLLEMEKQQEMRVYVFAQKLNLTFKVIGPIFGSWQWGFGVPYVRRHFNLMYRRGAFSPPPDVLLEMGGRIKVQFESPLARAQRMEEIESVEGAMSQVLPIAEAQAKFQGYPEILDKYNFDRFADVVNMSYGVPAIITNSDKEVAVLRKSRAEANAKQQMNQELMGMAEGMGKAAPMVKAMQGNEAA